MSQFKFMAKVNQLEISYSPPTHTIILQLAGQCPEAACAAMYLHNAMRSRVPVLVTIQDMPKPIRAAAPRRRKKKRGGLHLTGPAPGATDTP